MLTIVNVKLCNVKYMGNGNTKEEKKIVFKIMLVMMI